MPDSLSADMFATAWRTALDAGTPSVDFDAAEVVLRHSRARMIESLETGHPAFVLDLSPDRMSRLARLLPHEGVSLESPLLGEALASALEVARAETATSFTVRPIRRAHALLELMTKLQLARLVSAADLVWIFDQDEHAVPEFYPLLHDYCFAHESLPEEIVGLVADLRANEEDSPTLDRLAAWVVPSVTGMTDLAGWENGVRCLDREWREATARWARDEHDAAEDAPILRSLVEESYNAAMVRRAFQQHGEEARKALLEAADSHPHASLKKIFGVWIAMLGGAQ